MVVGTVVVGEHAGPSTAGKWRRSASWADYAGRCEGKATYIKGDVRRALTHKLSSWKVQKTDRSSPRNKVHDTTSSKSLASTATTAASTAPSLGLTDTCPAERPSDISSGVVVSVDASELQPHLSSDVRFTGSEVKIESATRENAAAMDMESASETHGAETELKIEKIEEMESASETRGVESEQKIEKSEEMDSASEPRGAETEQRIEKIEEMESASEPRGVESEQKIEKSEEMESASDTRGVETEQRIEKIEEMESALETCGVETEQKIEKIAEMESALETRGVETEQKIEKIEEMESASEPRGAETELKIEKIEEKEPALETRGVETEQKIEKVDEIEVAETKVETVAVTSEMDLKRKQNVKVLFASTVAHNFALQLTIPASQSIGLKHFNGDFIEQAAKQSAFMATALAIGVFVNPVIAGTSDVVGRKPVVIGGLALSSLGKFICAMQPNVNGLTVQSVLLMPLAMGAHNLGVQTTLGDLFSGDGAGFGAAQAQMLLATTLPGLVCPLIGASLTQRFGPAVPFAVAGIVEGSALLMDSKLLQETQPKEERKPLEVRRALKSANPLAFLELFRHGPRLSLLTVLRMFNLACDKSSLMQVLLLHRNEVTGLTLQQNAMYMVSAFFVAASGFSVAGPLMHKFGPSTCLQVGLCTRVVESLILSKSASLSTWRAVLPLGVTGAAASTSVSAMLQNEATRMKLNQGQFQGSLSSLNSVTQVVMTLLWARLYAFGSRRGRSGMYLRVVAVMCGLQLLLERFLSKTMMGHQNAVTSHA